MKAISLACLLALPAIGAQPASVRFFDTGIPSPAPLTGDILSKKEGWTAIPEESEQPVFKGDAVLMNERLALVFRTGATGAEVYSVGPGAPTLRTVLAPTGEATASGLSSFKLVENSAGAGTLEACFSAAGNKTVSVRYELKAGQPYVQTEARAGATGLRVSAPCRFLTLPDFFADDIVIDAADLRVSQAELPSDNVLLHLLPGGQAIVMTVAKSSEEDARVKLSGEGRNRRFDTSELRYGKEGKIWVAVLSGEAIWHEQEVRQEQAGQIIRLDWKAPFAAQWRVDWRRDRDLTDSWEMINERPDGSFAKHGLYGGPETIPASRQRWTTVLGTFKYPAWLDQQGRGYLQPFATRALRFEGPAVIYPVNRVSATALETFTVLDIVRNTLGVGPCEFILDIEGQRSKYKGRATCSVRDTLNPIYASKQQIQRKAEIEKVLQDLMIFIRHIRGRIEGYVAFGHETLAYLKQQKNDHPELAPELAEMENVVQVIDAKFAARRKEIKTPEEAEVMVEEFRQTVLNYAGDDALARCKRFTEAWVGIGGNQDELAGECRWAVKMVRQRAGLLMARDPRLSEIAKEVRRRSQVVLRNPANHEGARH
jgi:hypothetical protein